MMKVTVEQIEALLPQTQCELCEYPGCKPYAEAIINHHERIDKCLPGGVATLKAIAAKMGVDATAMLAEMQQKQKSDCRVVIREAECIGCTKCIQACPVDAIIGASKQMHTVISDACNGCELCIAPCPVDCIDILPLPTRDAQQKQALATQSKQRFLAHQQHQHRQAELIEQKHQAAKLNRQKDTIEARQQAIAAAITRVKNKKGSA